MRERLSDSLAGEEKAHKDNGKANSEIVIYCFYIDLTRSSIHSQ